jgi:L-ascorbate metabolism protein UlaG (beta-lactamase superfamily)
VSTTVSVTWWGHATTTIELGGRRVLTDPVLTARIAHLSRLGGSVPGRAALRADVAVVSHLHMDHLDVPSLRMLGASVRIVAPNGAARALSRSAPELARRVEQVGPGDVVDVDGVRLRAVPAEHDGRRSPVSRYHGPALGFVLEADGGGNPQRVWFAGDTGLFDAMAEIGSVEVAVVPVGGWGPTLGPTHLDPAQAAEAVRRVGARDAVPVHYGTFWPTGLRHVHPASFRRCFTGPGERFADELAAACPGARAHVIGSGQTVLLPGAGAG